MTRKDIAAVFQGFAVGMVIGTLIYLGAQLLGF